MMYPISAETVTRSGLSFTGPRVVALWDDFKPTAEASFPLIPPFKLSMLRISPSMGHVLDMNMSLRHLLFLLEYCMVTGYDWWDILLHVQPSMVQNLVEKLHEEYMRQNAALQQVGALGSLPGGHGDTQGLGVGSSQCQSSGHW